MKRPTILLTTVLALVALADCVPMATPTPTPKPIPNPVWGKVTSSEPPSDAYPVADMVPVSSVKYLTHQWNNTEPGIIEWWLEEGSNLVPISGGGKYNLTSFRDLYVNLEGVKWIWFSYRSSGAIVIKMTASSGAARFDCSKFQGLDYLYRVGDGVCSCPPKYGNWGGFLVPSPQCKYTNNTPDGDLIK